MAISYLEGITQMEIRPASSDKNDVQFEMVTSEFTNLCCRVDTSYDLVVRDVDSGVILFSINGAEIKNHPVEVYAEKPVGNIENGKICFVGSNSNAVKIEETEGQYNINRSLVRVAPGQVKLDWPQNVSNEMKVMTIAFALNISLTKYKSTVAKGFRKGGRQLTFCQLSRHHFTASCTHNEIVPESSKPISDFVFEPSNFEQKFWLKTVGLTPMKRTVAVAMDQKGRVILTIENQYSANANAAKTVVRNISGREEFTACYANSKSAGLRVYNIQSSGLDLGQVVQTRMYKIIDHVRADGTSTLNCAAASKEDTHMEFRDDTGHLYGTIDKQFYTALSIKLEPRVSPIKKKLIVTAAIDFFGVFLKNFLHQPTMMLYPMTCNCNRCQNLPSYKFASAPPDFRLYSTETLKLKALGHNKRKNLTYFVAFPKNGGDVLCTLEVTPVQDFKGVAKIVCKTQGGFSLFTSLRFIDENIIAVYNSTKNLMGFIKGNEIIDLDHKTQMKISSVLKQPKYNEKLFGPNVRCYINKNSTVYTSCITSRFCCVTMYRPNKNNPPLTQFELIFELTLAAICHSYVFQFDKIPTPEIFSHY